MSNMNSQTTHRSYRKSIINSALVASLGLGASLANADSLGSYDRMVIDLMNGGQSAAGVVDGVVADAPMGISPIASEFRFELPVAFSPSLVGVFAGMHSSDSSRGFEGVVVDQADTTVGLTFGAAISGLNKSDMSSNTDGIRVVPLPTAALAGFGMLVGIAGVGYVRRSHR
ncbi:MAG: hypothetical protein ACWA5W_01805 [Phycisphaerales bacterium]